MEFYDWLIENDISYSSFCISVFIILSVTYLFYNLGPFIWYIITFFLVYFGFWNDIKRDRFMWSSDTFLYRTVLNKYDDLGFAVGSLFYSHKVNAYKKRHRI